MPKKPTSKSNASPSTTDDWMAPVLTADEEADVEIVEKQESKGKGKKSKGSRKTGSKGENAPANTISKSSSMNLKPKSASKQMPIRKKTKGRKGSRSKSSTQSLDRATGGADTSRNSAAGTSNSKKGPIICGSRKKGSKTKGSKSPSKKKVRTPGPCAVKVKKGNRRRRPKKASKKKSKESDSRPPSSMTSSQSESVDENLPMVCSFWPRAASKKDANHIITVIRSAERVDRVFGADWPRTEAPYGHLAPTDLNIPSNNLSEKFLAAGFFEDNPPITPFGKYTTQLMGRALANRGVKTNLLICSPALRSIQTAEALAKFLKAKIAIEPGLVEPLAWYRGTNKNAPDFHLDQVVKLYPIYTDYAPVITMETISRSFDNETELQGVNRVDFVLRSLASEQRNDSLVVVGHAIVLAAAVTLANSDTENGESRRALSESLDMLEGDVIDRVSLGLRYPPGSVVALNLINSGPPMVYELCPGVVPPLSYGEFHSNRPVLEPVA